MGRGGLGIKISPPYHRAREPVYPYPVYPVVPVPRLPHDLGLGLAGTHWI